MFKKIKNKIIRILLDLIKVKIKGEHFIFSVSPEIKEDTSDFNRVQYAIQEFVRHGRTDLLNLYKEKGLVNFQGVKENLIASTGKNVFARLLTGDQTYTGEITHGALGNGASPVFSSSDTQLNNEVFRKAPSSSAYDNNIAFVDFFFAASDVADGTYTEWMTVIDGTAVENSGQAFSLLATGGWVKSKSMYVSSKYVIV